MLPNPARRVMPEGPCNDEGHHWNTRIAAPPYSVYGAVAGDKGPLPLLALAVSAGLRRYDGLGIQEDTL
jgi:hypothetical protein